MSLGEHAAGDVGRPISVVPLPERVRPRRRRRRLVLAGTAFLLVAAAVVLTVLAATYQPLMFEGETGNAFPGLPSGVGLQHVNTFGGADGEMYIPPQRGTFNVVTSIYNYGPEAVSIEAVQISPPGTSPRVSQAVRLAGRVHYFLANASTSSSAVFRSGMSLPPNQGFVFGVPLRLSSTCFYNNGWTSISQVWVEEGYLAFSHWVTVPLDPPLVMEIPVPRGTRGATCLP